MLEAAVRGAGKAAELIDLRRHTGVHPTSGRDGRDTVCAARRFDAREIAWRSPIAPAKKSGSASACRCISMKPPPSCPSASGWKTFAGRLRRPPSRYWRYCRAPHCRRRDGRRANFLIAYNIDLTTPDTAIAKQIAAKIRESSGGFRFVKAMGLHLAIARLRAGLHEPHQLRRHSAR